MKNLFKVLFVIVISLSVSLPVRAYDEQEEISVTITISAVTSLSVSYLDTATGGTGSGALTFDVSSLDLSDTGTYWSVAEDCLLVSYSSNYAWGLRIVTDNYILVEDALSSAGATATDINSDGDIDILDYVAPSRIALDSDGVYDDNSYGGLLSLEDINDVITGAGSVIPEDDQDPSKRAVWAWSAEDEWSTGYSSSLPSATQVAYGSGYMIQDVDVGYCWTYADHEAWAYIADKSDDGFSEDIYEDYDGDGVANEITYSIVSAGMPGSYGSLVPYTFMVSDSDGDTYTDMVDLADDDVVIYIAARFAATNFGDVSEPVPYVLTPDTYESRLYVELIHE